MDILWNTFLMESTFCSLSKFNYKLGDRQKLVAYLLSWEKVNNSFTFACFVLQTTNTSKAQWSYYLNFFTKLKLTLDIKGIALVTYFP